MKKIITLLLTCLMFYSNTCQAFDAKPTTYNWFSRTVQYCKDNPLTVAISGVAIAAGIIGYAAYKAFYGKRVGAQQPRQRAMQDQRNRAALFAQRAQRLYCQQRNVRVLEQEFKRVLEQEFLVAAARGNRDAIVQSLAQGVDINIQDAAGNTALHRIIKNNQISDQLRLSLVTTLLKKGAEVMLQNAQGNTVLHEAVLQGDSRVAFAILLNAHMGCPSTPQTIQHALNASPHTLAWSLPEIAALIQEQDGYGQRYLCANRWAEMLVEQKLHLLEPLLQMPDGQGRTVFEIAQEHNMRTFLHLDYLRDRGQQWLCNQLLDLSNTKK